MGSRQYRDSRGSTGTTNPVRPRKKGDAIAPTRQRKKKTFSQEWVHLYGNTEELARLMLIRRNNHTWHKLFFFFMLGTTSLSLNKISGRQWHCLRSPFMARWSSPLKPGAISLPNSEKMGRGAVRRIKLTSSAIVSAPEFNLNVNLCGQDVNRMLSIKIYPAA